MPASVALLPPSTACPAHCQAIARMRASNSNRRRMSACHSGSGTPNSRGASIATSIRSRCPALLRLRSAVAANARFSRGSWDKRAAASRRRWPQQICQQFDQHAFRSYASCSYRCLFRIYDEPELSLTQSAAPVLEADPRVDDHAFTVLETRISPAFVVLGPDFQYEYQLGLIALDNAELPAAISVNL